MEEIRWKYRFDNFTKAYIVLEKSLKISSPSEVEQAGVIQFYEMTFELAWKTLKDYLQEEGFEVKSPKATIKQAIQIEFIDDPYAWLDALEDRNLTAHTYDQETANRVYSSIKKIYFPLIKKLYNTLNNEL